MAEFILEVFPGGYDLPSIDFDCLVALTYCRFIAVPVKVVEYRSIYFKQLPALKSANGDTVVGSSQIIDYLNKSNYGFYAKYYAGGDKKMRIDIKSYVALMEEKFFPCLNYLWWYDVDNYNQFLRGCFAERMAFPLNFFMPGRIRRKNIERLQMNYTTQVLERDLISKDMENNVINQAKYCLNLMFPKLNEGRTYFYGDIPTAVDVYLFAYLALLYKVPCKNQILKNHIASKPFVDYIERILKIYFEQNKTGPSKSPFDLVVEDGNTIKYNDLLLSASFAAILMIFYAFYNGLVRIEPSDNDYEEEDEE